jgi:hypothetical protein
MFMRYLGGGVGHRTQQQYVVETEEDAMDIDDIDFLVQKNWESDDDDSEGSEDEDEDLGPEDGKDWQDEDYGDF